MTDHTLRMTSEYSRSGRGRVHTGRCSCGWSHTITDTAPIPPPTLYRHHKTHRETT